MAGSRQALAGRPAAGRNDAICRRQAERQAVQAVVKRGDPGRRQVRTSNEAGRRRQNGRCRTYPAGGATQKWCLAEQNGRQKFQAAGMRQAAGTQAENPGR